MNPHSLQPDEFAHMYADVYSALRLVALGEAGASGADDVVQKAAIVALERLDRFEKGTDFRAWMAAIVRGVAKNHRRSEQRRSTRTRQFADVARKTGSIQESPPPEDSQEQTSRILQDSSSTDDFDDDLRNALAMLEPKQRTCLLLRSVGDLSYLEIEKLLGIPVTTVRSHVFRARKRILEILGSQGREYET